MMRLSDKIGIALPRKNYSLTRHIPKQEEKGLKIQAAVVEEWETLKEISDTISNFIEINKL